MKKFNFLSLFVLLTFCLCNAATVVERNGISVLCVDKEILSKSVEKGNFQAGKVESPPVAKQAAKSLKSVSVDNLVGYYFSVDYNTASPSVVARKYMMQISKDAGSDSLLIYNLIGGQKTVKGVYDSASGVIKIKPQVTYSQSEYGDFYCCPIDFNKMIYNPKGEVNLVVDKRGNISIGGWGVFILTGDNKGLQIANKRSVMTKANVTITDYSLSKTDDANKVRTYPACYTRESNSSIEIKNFYNNGAELVMNVDSVGNIAVPRSVIGVSGYTKYYNYCITSYTSASNVKLSASESTKGKFEGNTITLNAWACARGTSSSAISESIEKTVIAAPEVFVQYSNALAFKGAGTAEDPYQISSAADIEALANTANHNSNYLNGKNAFTGKYFRQTANIDMSSVINHEPIGDGEVVMFDGEYDGGNYTISNLNINRRELRYAGLFGRTGENAVIKNLKVAGVTISSDKTHVGTIVGENNGKVENITVTGGEIGNPAFYTGGVIGMNYGPVANVSYSGSVIGESMVGGVLGVSYGTLSNAWSDATVSSSLKGAYIGGVCGSASRITTLFENCYFTGAVADNFGGSNIGGIIGYMDKGTIKNCWNGGQVNSSFKDAHTGAAGGIVGYINGGVVLDSHNSGIIRSFTSDIVGGIIGKAVKGKEGTASASDAPVIKNCLNTGYILCKPNVLNNELIGLTSGEVDMSNTFFDNQVSYNGSKENGKSTAELTSGNAIEGFNAEVWSFRSKKYPMMSAVVNVDKAKLDAEPFFLNEGESVQKVKSSFTIGTDNNVKWSLFKNTKYATEGNGLSISGNKVIFKATKMVSDTLVALRGNDFRIYVLKVVPDEFEGKGTAESPYLIKSKADIDKIANAVDKEIYNYRDTYFALANDIDMGGNTGFIGMSIHGADYAFNGTLDGQNHSIKNWIVDRVKLKNGIPDMNTDNTMAGLFIYTGVDAVIKNLNIASDCNLIAGSYVAPIAAYNGGKIINCRNAATVKAIKTNAAGIVAYNAADAEVSDCYNGGTIVSGKLNAAGLVGSNYGTVSGCQNDGSVSLDFISTYWNDSTETENCGGIVAYNYNMVDNCVSNGVVKAFANVGGIAGYNTGKATIKNSIVTGPVVCVYDAATRGGVAGNYVSNSSIFENNYYDRQVASDVDVKNTMVSGVNQKTTAELTSGKAIEGFSADKWIFAAGSMPVLASFKDEPFSKFNSRSYVTFKVYDRVDSRFSVKKDAEITLVEKAKASLKVGKSFNIDGSALKLQSITEAAYDTLIISDGTYVKTYPLFAAPKMLPNGDGTKANPWKIASVADWNTIANYSLSYAASFEDEYFVLENNLSFKDTEFIPLINDGTTRFQGRFNGNGKTIDDVIYHNEDSKLGMNKGIFGMLGDKSEVTNLTLGKNSKIEAYQYVGGFAGLGAGLISDCKNYATVSTTKMGFCGGFIGTANTGAKFVNCENYGNVISANGQGGGISGSTDDEVSFDNCSNEGAINAKYSVGGIVGSSKAIVTNSLNKGDVSSLSYNAGGIVGYQAGENVVKNCVNHGAVSTTTYNSAGIVGNMFAASSVVNCQNYGDIYSKTYGAGGIAGNINRGGSVIDSCQNYGNVVSDSYATAGIVAVTTGDEGNHSVVKNSANYAKVSSAKYKVGGIVGEIKKYTDVVNVLNSGDVLGTYNLGGIVGVSTGVGSISCAANLGDVKSVGTSATTAYNVGGVLGTGKVEITDAYNTGDVLGYKQVGGIVGLAASGSATLFGTSVDRAYNTGAVECKVAANETGCGNIYGGSKLKYVKFDNVYFDKQNAVKTFANDTAGAVTTAELVALNLGEKWQSGEYCYPVLKSFADSAEVKLSSAAVVLAAEDTFTSVKEAFYVGVPEGIEWTTSSNLKLEGNKVIPINENANEEATLTATNAKGQSLTYTITLTKPSGVEGINADKDIESVVYVTTSGITLPKPVAGVNIKKTTYTDGTYKVEKVVVNE